MSVEKSKCINCHKNIRKNQSFLTCTHCLQVTHIKCTGINKKKKENCISDNWKCSVFDELPFPFATCSDHEFLKEVLSDAKQTNSKLNAVELNSQFSDIDDCVNSVNRDTSTCDGDTFSKDFNDMYMSPVNKHKCFD